MQEVKKDWITLRPLALLIARRGLKTRNTRKIFTTEIVPDLSVVNK